MENPELLEFGDFSFKASDSLQTDVLYRQNSLTFESTVNLVYQGLVKSPQTWKIRGNFALIRGVELLSRPTTATLFTLLIVMV